MSEELRAQVEAGIAELGPLPSPPPRDYESGSAKRKQSAFREISATGLSADVVRGIKHRVAMLDKSPERARKHFRRSLITAALILDFKARNSGDVEELKSAVTGLISVVNNLFPKKTAPKK